MARTKENENITRNAEMTAEGQANQSYNDFNKNVSTLERGGSVAANPYLSAPYLSNVNRLQSGTLNSATNAGTNQIQQENRRTGGLNTGATVGAIKDIALQKTRLGNQLSSERAAGDFGKNVNYQTDITGMSLAPYSAAMGGVDSLNQDLTRYGTNPKLPYLAPAIEAAGSVAAAL